MKLAKSLKPSDEKYFAIQIALTEILITFSKCYPSPSRKIVSLKKNGLERLETKNVIIVEVYLVLSKETFQS